MEPNYTDIKYSLVYFKFDKRIYIYGTDDVLGWNEMVYEKLLKNEKVCLEAEYEFVKYKVSYKFYTSC